MVLTWIGSGREKGAAAAGVGGELGRDERGDERGGSSKCGGARAWVTGSESGAGGRWRLRVDLNRGRGVELGFGCGGERGDKGGGFWATGGGGGISFLFLFSVHRWMDGCGMER